MLHPRRRTRLLLACLGPLALACAGCATGTTALWRAGASRAELEDVELGMPTPAAGVALHYKEGFGPFEETESKRAFACSTTTVLRKARLVDGEPRGLPERDYEVLAHVSTEEFPRDRSSKILSSEFSSVLGTGGDLFELFEIQIDPAFLPDARARLREYAGRLGADAVIEVFATGEAEFHMWEGFGFGFDTRSTESPIYSSGTLLDFTLRDVRLHGTAVRYVD